MDPPQISSRYYAKTMPSEDMFNKINVDNGVSSLSGFAIGSKGLLEVAAERGPPSFSSEKLPI